LGIYRSLHHEGASNLIYASGSIEADETIIAPKIGGNLSRLLVDEGFDVKKGRLLAVLDDTELRAQLGQAQAAAAAAQAKLDEVVRGNRPEQIQQARAQLLAAESAALGAREAFGTAKRNIRTVTDLQLQVDSAQSKLDAAKAADRQAREALRLLQAGNRPQEIDQARAELAQANVNLDHANVSFSRIDLLAQEGALAQQNADDARAARDGAQKAVDAAQAHLNDLLAGPRPEELREAEMQVLQTKANLDGAVLGLQDAQESYHDRLSAQGQFDSTSSGAKEAQAQVAAAQANLNLMLAGSRPEDIRDAKAAKQQADQAVDYARELVGDTRLYAPCDSVVKTKSALPGEALTAGSPVVTLADLDHIWIRVYVPEDQYGKLSLGQAVDVTVDSFPHERFKGTILSIASDAEFTPKNTQTPEERVKLVFAVKIGVENPGRRLKPGMPGDATIYVR